MREKAKKVRQFSLEIEIVTHVPKTSIEKPEWSIISSYNIRRLDEAKNFHLKNEKFKNALQILTHIEIIDNYRRSHNKILYKLTPEERQTELSDDKKEVNELNELLINATQIEETPIIITTPVVKLTHQVTKIIKRDSLREIKRTTQTHYISRKKRRDNRSPKRRISRSLPSSNKNTH